VLAGCQKEGLLQKANHVFTGTGVQVTSTGRPYLGAVLDSTTFTNLFTQKRFSEWIEGVSHLLRHSLMHLILLLLTVIFPSGNTIFVPPQIFPTCFLLLSLLFVATFFLSWYCILLVTMSINCFAFWKSGNQ